MASIFTRALDRITPWNRGGEVQRRQEKKKKDEEEARRKAQQQSKAPTNRPNQNVTPQNQPLNPQRPVNLFEDLNKNLGTNPNIVPVFKNASVVVPPPPQPGAVVQPEDPNDPKNIVNRGLDQGKSWEQIARENNLDLEGVKQFSEATRPNYGITVQKPNQSFGDRLRDIADANSEADKWRRQEGNRTKGEQKPINQRNPVVDFAKRNLAPTGVFNIGKEIVQGVVRSPIELGQTVEHSYRTVQENERLKREGFKGTTEERESQARENAKSKTWTPTGWQARIFGDNPVQSFQASSAELSNLVEEKTGKKPSPVALAAAMVGLSGIPGGIFGKSGNKADDVLEAFLRNADEATPNIVRTPTTIPVQQNIPIDEVVGKSVEVPVNVRTPQKPTGPIIRELGGDATGTTPAATVADNVIQVRQAEANAINNVPTDARIQGVTPRSAEPPFALKPGDAAAGQAKVVDDYAIMLREVGEGNGVDITPDGRRVSNNFRPGDTKGKSMSKSAWRDEAERQLLAGEAEPNLQRAFNEASDPEIQAMLAKGARPDAPEGTPIAVKQVQGINVIDNTDVPQNLPEIPGTVRPTAQSSPMAAKTEAVASTPAANRASEIQKMLKEMENDSSVAGAELKDKLYGELEGLQAPEAVAPAVSRPATLPAEVQSVLDNPKQFNKRQIAAARNQRKLANQMAKTKEDTAAAMERIETASPAAQSGEGFVPTGEFGTSVNGGPIQRVSRATEMQQAVQETANMSPQDIIQTARKSQAETGGFNPRDMRNVRALVESKRIARGTPEWQEARAILKEDGTVWGQTGALRNHTLRRNATTNELISRYESKIYRLAEDPTKIKSQWFDEVEAAEDAFVTARDQATAAFNEFTRNPTSANAKIYHAAQDAADKADTAAKQAEFTVANKALKGNKDVKQIRELDKMANEADLYQMDAVDASMLSGTGTFIRNFVNAAVGGVEESLFGGVASRVSRLFTGEKVGGGAGKGTLKGFGEGVDNLRSVAGARAKNAGFNPLEHVKNWSTTGNQLGDTIIDSQVRHNVLDHYKGVLKEQGYTGRELRDRASVMARQDPDNLGREYAGAARVAAGLGAGVTRNNKIETLIKNVVSDAVSAGKPSPFTEAAGKLVARMTIGFPTAIGRSTIEGIKRFTLGAPTFVKAVREADAVKRSILIKEGVKQAGTGALVLPPVFYALGANDMISGSYPEDEATRAQWAREGKTENSIKIGGAWYQLPAYLGAWAVPGLFYASLGRSGGNFSEAAADTAKAVPSLLPTDQASNMMDFINGRIDPGKYMAQTAASAVRATTPAGALLNQIAKSLDPTKNDTNSGSNWENFVDKVLSGIPGVNNMADIPDKTTDEGVPITNPNPLEILAGAASDVQGSGEERSREIKSETDSQLQGLRDAGVFDDPNIKEVLDDKEKAIYQKIASGKELKEGELDTLQKAFTKGVSSTGEDTAYLEREQYDSNLRALRLKREQMNSDKTVKPSDLAKVDVAIKRGEIYKETEIPYELITEYKDVGVEEWRKMGDPEEDEYDPDAYQRLWDIDKLMTDKGVSYKKGALDKPKYAAKDSGKGGRGGSGSRKIDTDFGTLQEGKYAPKVQQYDTIERKSGSVPIIRTVRPNIVHKITSSG